MILSYQSKKRYQKELLDCNNVPQHMAFIMDGNGRWGKEKGLPRTAGHKAGVDALKKVIKYCLNFSVKHLSVYAFSTENWLRPKAEVTFLMNLLKVVGKKELPKLMNEGVKVTFIGTKENLDQSILKTFTEIENQTKNNKALQFNIMFNYGGRRDILDGVQRYLHDYKTNPHLKLTEDLFSTYLSTHNSPDPDVLVRTSNEIRISNFMLWESSYTELIFLEKCWPDFNENDFISVLKEFQSRKRRYGDI